MKKSITSLKKRADKLLQEKYTKIYHICLVCGKTPVQMHHYVPKGRSNQLRYEPLNLVPLCPGCHTKHHLSGDPHIQNTIEQIKGQEWVNSLEKRRYIFKKFNIGYLEEIIKELEDK